MTVYSFRRLLLLFVAACLAWTPVQGQRASAPRVLTIAELQQQFGESESTLVTVYNDLVSLLFAIDKAKSSALETSQQAWVSYRKEQANLLADGAETAQARWENTFYEELTRLNTNRIAELRVLHAIYEAHFRKRYPGRQFSSPSTNVTPNPRAPLPRN